PRGPTGSTSSDHPRFAGWRTGRRGAGLIVERLDLSPAAGDDLAQLLEPLGIVQRAGALAEQRPCQLLDLVHQVRHLRLLRRVPPGADARADVVDSGLLLVEVAAAFVGDGVDLLALFLTRADVAQVFEHLQGRIDRARARAVATVHA